MTAQARPGAHVGETPADRLTAIADSVRGSFQTVESMAQSFIREAILQGIYKPGERLNQDAIAEILGVSRMPVRASLRALEAEGLILIYPHRGATVCVLQAQEIVEIYELRVIIECYLLGLAMDNLTPEDLADLKELVEQLDDKSPVTERLERRKEVYERIYELSERPRALATAKQLRDAVGRYLLLIPPDDFQGHESLLVHLQSGDKAAAQKWLASHLMSVSKKLQKVVPEVGL
jgi:DNA-binding GntR family transcriptional regulator